MEQPHFVFGHLPFWLVTYTLALTAWACIGRDGSKLTSPPKRVKVASTGTFICRKLTLKRERAVSIGAAVAATIDAQVAMPAHAKVIQTFIDVFRVFRAAFNCADQIWAASLESCAPAADHDRASDV